MEDPGGGCCSLKLAGMVLALLLLAALPVAWVLAADPGSKEDPLLTLGYVKRYVHFARHELPAGESLRLGANSELVLLGSTASAVEAEIFNPLRDQLVDLSDGAPVRSTELALHHHYVNASSHDIFLRFEAAMPMLVRGEWK